VRKVNKETGWLCLVDPILPEYNLDHGILGVRLAYIHESNLIQDKDLERKVDNQPVATEVGRREIRPLIIQHPRK
jgi:hypothetical protein